MCGIVGFTNLEQRIKKDYFKNLITEMANTLISRGPDDMGVWINDNNTFALGFRRLSIIDLSPTGNQPMMSKDGRYVIVFNGEVYNYRNLKNELTKAGHGFIGSSDTEVMLAAITEWGVVESAKRFNGMFAYAVWDQEKRRLSLIRDRIGIKPLYYSKQGSVLLFGSSIKPLELYPFINFTIDQDALSLYLKYGYIPAPYSIYKEIKKVMPGTILNIDIEKPGKDIEAITYWSTKNVVESGLKYPFVGTQEDAILELERILKRSIKDRMAADVPLGAFLSGGIDSSLVTALMQSQSNKQVKTFTIGFNIPGYNEAEFAKQVSEHLKTDHTELYINPDEVLDVIPLIPSMYDEPFADSSQIPTYLVAKMAKKKVTVCLSGDGGDELFGGYNRYYWLPKIWNKLKYVPNILRKTSNNFFTSLNDLDWSKMYKMFGADINSSRSYEKFKYRLNMLATSFRYNNPYEMYDTFGSICMNPDSITKATGFPKTIINSKETWPEFNDIIQWAMYIDLNRYLPDDGLTKLDRAGMAVSLESRGPLLDDHRVVEFAWTLPVSMKLNGKTNKWILRQVLYKHIPKTLMDRPKMGFMMPLAQWLRGPLVPWAEDLLYSQSFKHNDYLKSDVIYKYWDEHKSGKQNWHNQLWAILIFQAWRESR